MFYVYALKSIVNGKIYIGRTKDLKRRINEHNSGQTYTTKRMGKLKLIFYEAVLSKKDSIRRERYLKTSKGKSSLKQILRYSINEQ